MLTAKLPSRKHLERGLSVALPFTAMNAPTVNPRRAKYTDRKRAQRAAMGRRWEKADRTVQREAGDVLLGVSLAWRRWSNDTVDGSAVRV